MLKTVSSVANVIGSLSYQGTWDANSNTPALTSSVGTKGDYYVVSVAGTTNLNGITDWQIGDWAVFNGSIWEKVDNTDAVISVNGQTGIVVLTASNVGATPNTTYVISGTGLSGGGQLNANVTINLANTTVTAGSYGNASTVGTFTVDAQGRLTAAADAQISIAASQVTGSNITLGNTTLTLGGTTTSVGNLTLTNVTLTGTTQAYVAKTGAYTATPTDYTIAASAAGGSFSVTLPTSVGITGKVYTIKKTDSTANTVTVDTTLSQTIDGATTKVLSIQYDAITVQSDGANWIIIGMVFGRNGAAGSF